MDRLLWRRAHRVLQRLLYGVLLGSELPCRRSVDPFLYRETTDHNSNVQRGIRLLGRKTIQLSEIRTRSILASMDWVWVGGKSR